MKKIKEIEKIECICPKCQCKSCGHREMTVKHQTKKVAMNHYVLEDWYICKKCRQVHVENLGEQNYVVPAQPGLV